MEDTTDQSRLENIELRNLERNEEDLWDNEERELKYLRGDEEDPLDNERTENTNDKYITKLEHFKSDWFLPDNAETQNLSGLFTVGRTHEARNIEFFLEDFPLLERGVVNPRFVKYLMEKEASITKTLSPSGIVTEYEISFYGEPFRNDDGVLIRPARKFKTTNGVIADPNEFNQAFRDIRYHYDRFRDLELRKRLKKAGIVTGIAITVASLVTGLALGLRRKGSDLVCDSKEDAKIGPSGKMIPWTELQEATGKSLILIGDYIYVIIGGSLIYLYSTNSKRS